MIAVQVLVWRHRKLQGGYDSRLRKAEVLALRPHLGIRNHSSSAIHGDILQVFQIYHLSLAIRRGSSGLSICSQEQIPTV